MLLRRTHYYNYYYSAFRKSPYDMTTPNMTPNMTKIIFTNLFQDLIFGIKTTRIAHGRTSDVIIVQSAPVMASVRASLKPP